MPAWTKSWVAQCDYYTVLTKLLNEANEILILMPACSMRIKCSASHEHHVLLFTLSLCLQRGGTQRGGTPLVSFCSQFVLQCGSGKRQGKLTAPAPPPPAPAAVAVGLAALVTRARAPWASNVCAAVAAPPPLAASPDSINIVSSSSPSTLVPLTPRVTLGDTPAEGKV